MKTFVYLLLVLGFLIGCNTSKQISSNSNNNEEQNKMVSNDTVKIANDDLEYEIIIIEPGFNFWLTSRARPEGYYSQQFLENRNYQFVIEWNQRVLQPNRFNSNLYEMQIDYQPGIDYGYDVNYKLYNYFIYFQLTYNQRLGNFVPRI
ncbi:DUF6146 family protein [Jejuia spongiicola]|uniref:DUF6146 family protein n=1 Tax=Jejuia spongiicola TaxID=2942207 RepID=A0ABT0QG16_9FLAO|nr:MULTISPECIES: DUF6146 family protein [Flavobacteriaceae]MCL6295936.1 DUF6146 family protein [Jejuia spongiicola]PIA82083.1 hypothetical protein BFR04_12345 [Gaetbulibacter sp. 4G1]